MRILATIEKDIKITVVGSSAKEMLQEINNSDRKEIQENFILSLQEEVDEYLEWRKAGGY